MAFAEEAINGSTLATKEVLTQLSMELTIGRIGAIIVTLASVIFAYSTLLGWCYYGEKSVEYLLGAKSVPVYRVVFVVVILLGTTVSMGVIITVSDIMNALMAIPNLIGLVLLARVVQRETDAYFRKIKTIEEME